MTSDAERQAFPTDAGPDMSGPASSDLGTTGPGGADELGLDAPEPSAPEPGTAEPGAPGVTPKAGGRLTRRSFVVRAIAGIGGLIAVIVGVPVAGFAAMPFFRSKTPIRLLSDSVAPTLRSSDWASAGALSEYKVGVPKLAPLQRTVNDGWNSGTETVVVYVVRETDTDVTAFDIHCTHLGCPLSYSSGAQRFVCPCHGGTFDIEGLVMGGPPPRPMMRYETQVVDGNLMIGQLLADS